MTVERDDKGRRRPRGETDWELSERRSSWIALAIALVPIPVSVLISWALGSPPWRPRPHPGPGETMGPAMAPGRPGPATDPGHR